MKMTPDLWSKVKFFTPDENWGDPGKVSAVLVFKLDEYRQKIGRAFNLHNAYETAGHSATGEHPKGTAGDGHVKGMDLLDMFLVAEKIGFKGIGLYDWGIHLDVRVGDSARWCRINGVYQSLNAKNIDHLREVYKYGPPTLLHKVAGGQGRIT